MTDDRSDENNPQGASGKSGRPEATKAKRDPAETTPVLLAGGNPQIAKADGDAPVQAYIAAMPGWKRDARARASTRSSCAPCLTCARP